MDGEPIGRARARMRRWRGPGLARAGTTARTAGRPPRDHPLGAARAHDTAGHVPEIPPQRGGHAVAGRHGRVRRRGVDLSQAARREDEPLGVRRVERVDARPGAGLKAAVTSPPPTPARRGKHRAYDPDETARKLREADTMSVSMPRMIPRGMSRLGSTDSSAASGSCSIARKSHTANGIEAKAPGHPLGRNGP